jgi:hypothetical protein
MVEDRARQLAEAIPLPAEDWEIIISQAKRMLEVIATLDELPLDGVEPAPVFQVIP